MDTEEYRKKIELEILNIIEQKLKDGQMNESRAKSIAQHILSTLLPHLDINQIHTVVQKFDDYFTELVPVVSKVSYEYDEKIKKLVVQHVDLLISQNKFNEATHLIKKAINKELKL